MTPEELARLLALHQETIRGREIATGRADHVRQHSPPSLAPSPPVLLSPGLSPTAAAALPGPGGVPVPAVVLPTGHGTVGQFAAASERQRREDDLAARYVGRARVATPPAHAH